MDVRVGGINIKTVPFCIIGSLNDKVIPANAPSVE